MKSIGERIQYCEKCGFVTPISDFYLKSMGCKTEDDCNKYITTCSWCGGKTHFLDNDNILSYKKFNMGFNQTYREMNGYSSIDDFQFAMEQKVIKEYISKLPTFDEYAMYDRLEKKRIQKEQAARNAQRRREEEAKKPHCPTCNSTNIKKISGLSKAGSVALFGLFSQKVKKQWHCNSCGSEW